MYDADPGADTHFPSSDDDFFQPQTDSDDAGDDRIAFFDLDDAIHQSDAFDDSDLPHPEYAIVEVDGDETDDLDAVFNPTALASFRSQPHSLFVADPVLDGSAVMTHDGYDHHLWQEALRDYPKLREALVAANALVPTGAALLRDLFWSFVRRAVLADPIVPLGLAYEPNRRIVEEILATGEWRSVRDAGTVDDPLLAATAALGVVRAALAKLDDATCAHITRLLELESGAADLWAQAESLDDLAGQATGDKAVSLFRRAAQLRNTAIAQHEAATAEAQLLEDTADDMSDGVRRAVRPTLVAVADEIDAIEAAVMTFTGGYGSTPGFSSVGNTPPTFTARDKIALAQRVGASRRLQEIAALCGRMTRIALDVQRTRVTHPPDEVVNIRMGRDLSHIVPSQWALLADADTEDIFYQNFAEGRLVQYDLVGSEKLGQGPIICALDSSGSMADSIGSVTKEAWSKAVMLALLAIARKQGRDIVVLHFSGAGELREYRFPKGVADHLTVVECAEFFFGNGTIFEDWMLRTLRIVDETTFNRADVVCITDGLTTIDPQMQQEWQRRRTEKGMRVYGVLIGTNDGATVLASISDALLTLDDLEGDLPTLQTIFNL